MPRAKKETTATTTATKASITKTASEKTVAPKKTATAKTTTAKTTTAKTTTAKTTTAKTDVVDATLVADATPVVDATPTAAADFTALLSSVQELASKLSLIKTDLRNLEKKHARELKIASKGKKRAASKNPRAPSGFVKPTKISSELAAFLGKTEDTEMARTEVTKEINTYIRANNLQNKTNGRIINADAKLKTLLKLKNDDELTYFNLQRYMSHHFPKKVVAPVTAPVTVSV